MKASLASALIFLALPLSAHAGDNGPFLNGSKTPATSVTENCVEVEIGGEHTQKLDCINQQLKQQASHVQPIGNVPPLDAGSPAVKVHGFNETALSQQYGPNLGKSVVPYRPSR